MVLQAQIREVVDGVTNTLEEYEVLRHKWSVESRAAEPRLHISSCKMSRSGLIMSDGLRPASVMTLRLAKCIISPTN